MILTNVISLPFSPKTEIMSIKEFMVKYSPSLNQRIQKSQSKLTQSMDQFLVRVNWNADKTKLKQMAITLWTTSAVMMSTTVFAAKGKVSIWERMQPIFSVFQDIAMILGAMAILSGLIISVFKKRLGINIVITASMVVLGCFLVPAAVMLVAIIGQMLNDTLTEVFKDFKNNL